MISLLVWGFKKQAQAALFSGCFCFLIGIQSLYNVVLVSAGQQSELAICIHISPPSWVFLPAPRHPIPPL